MPATPAVLITGATGFIGSHVAERFIKEGWSVKLLVRSDKNLLPQLRAAEIIVGDLADHAILDNAAQGASVIIHCAANVKTWDTRKNYHAANVVGTTNLLLAVAGTGKPVARFVHLSTADVYNFPVESCSEDHALRLDGFGYGDSKVIGEEVVRQVCAKHDIPYTILRPCNVIGPRGQFTQRIGDALRSGPMLTIDRGLTNAGLLYIDNLVDVILWAASAQEAAGQCFNVRDDYDASWTEFLSSFRQLLNKNGWIINLPFKTADILSRLCAAFYRMALPGREPLLHPLLVRIFGRTCGHEVRKLRATSGLHGKIGFEEAMTRSVAWYRQQ